MKPTPASATRSSPSGWGAANASLLLLSEDPAFSDTVVVLDNDVARPDGGFGTRYPLFALIGVNPIPTPSDVPALAAVNTGYEYDYNSNAPADVLNPFAAVNALAAYLTTRLNQAELDLPVNADGTPSVNCDANTCAPSPPAAPSSIARRPLQLARGQDHRLRHDAGQHHLRHLHDQRTAADQADPRRPR